VKFVEVLKPIGKEASECPRVLSLARIGGLSLDEASRNEKRLPEAGFKRGQGIRFPIHNSLLIRGCRGVEGKRAFPSRKGDVDPRHVVESSMLFADDFDAGRTGCRRVASEQTRRGLPQDAAVFTDQKLLDGLEVRTVEQSRGPAIRALREGKGTVFRGECDRTRWGADKEACTLWEPVLFSDLGHGRTILSQV
jgi:hypothetical protein